MWEYVDGQYFGEKMMWVNVMRRAIHDYVLYKGTVKHSLVWRRANMFLFGDQDFEDTGLRFEEVCGLFGYEPGYVRRLIGKMSRVDVRRMESQGYVPRAAGGSEVGDHWNLDSDVRDLPVQPGLP